MKKSILKKFATVGCSLLIAFTFVAGYSVTSDNKVNAAYNHTQLFSLRHVVDIEHTEI
ncbi:MAG: hypothetical protein PHX70_13475 [Clostridium sp.]|nr:hypothetical protein [Clostridium sp.]